MATPHLNPSSDLIKLLSSLGLDTEQDNGGAQQQHEPLGPDPLVVARGRLTKLKADIDALAPLLKSLVDEGSSSPGEQVALRIQPPITSTSHTDSPPLLRLAAGQTWQEASAAAAKASRQPCSYLPFDSAAQAADYLRTLLTQLTQHFESLRSTLVAEAQERIRQTLAAASKDPAALADAAAGRERQVVDEDGRILNEEGLPFVDPTERIAESAAASSTNGTDRGSTVAPFKPQQTLEGEDRKKWIDHIFSRFEGLADEDDDEDEGEDAEDAKEGDVARKAPRTDPLSTPPPPPPPPQVKPLKSALKASPAPPLTTDSKFGHQGIRRGFLNMNPSSPAAVSSSDPIEARFDEVAPAAASMPMSRSHSQGESRSREREEEANVEAMTQSMTGLESFGAPTAASPAKSKKKSVRIQSPERSRKPATRAPADISASSAAASSSSSSADPDAGVEDEAARIVSLLGPEVVAGTERGEEALKSLRDEQAQAEEAARRQVEEIKRKKREQEENKAKGPAVGLSVMERPRGAAPSGSGATAAAVSAAKQSAFKRGFLNRPPPRAAAAAAASATSSAPASASSSAAGPRESLGMSALDRSLISDVPLEAERESQGLPPAVPHARPSKAYREKLEKRREQGDAAAMEVDDGGTAGESVVVGTGKEASSGGGKGVRFQLDSAAVSHQEADDDDEDMEDDEVAELREGDTAELELDEHDEEAYARSAYASGDVADDESGHAGTLGGDDDDDEEDAAHDSDWSLDSYEHYSASDLADLEPTFTGLVSDLENAELAREYALAKARQMQERQTMSEERRKELAMAISGERMKEEERLARGGGGGGDKEDELWREDEIDGRDLVSAMGFEEEEIKKRREVDPPNRMSRFKASRIVQALGMGVDGVSGEASNRPSAGFRERGTEEDRRADEAGHELAHLLEGATNAGPGGAVPGAEASSSSRTAPGPSPVMVLPSMTPLRYPKAPSTSAARVSNLKESDRLPKGGVDLEGETDEDEKDDVLMDVMRARLEEKEYKEKKRLEKEAEAAAKGSDVAAAAKRAQQAPPPRSRWNGIDEDDRDTRSGVAMAAPPSIGGGAAKAKKRELPVSSSSSSGTDAEQPSAPAAAAASPPPAQEAAAPQQKMSRFKAARLAAAAAANQQS